MANTKSAIKRIRRISRQTIVNKSRKSKFKNAIKKMNILLDTKKKKNARFNLTQVTPDQIKVKFIPYLNRETCYQVVVRKGFKGKDAVKSTMKEFGRVTKSRELGK